MKYEPKGPVQNRAFLVLSMACALVISACESSAITLPDKDEAVVPDDLCLDAPCMYFFNATEQQLKDVISTIEIFTGLALSGTPLQYRLQDFIPKARVYILDHLYLEGVNATRVIIRDVIDYRDSEGGSGVAPQADFMILNLYPLLAYFEYSLLNNRM